MNKFIAILLISLASFTSWGAPLNNTAVAPVIASGFGTTPTIVSANGTATFQLNVGTGGTASSGVITMPQAPVGWSCTAHPTAIIQAAAVTFVAPTNATSITVTNYTLTTGIALAWTASSIFLIDCIGY